MFAIKEVLILLREMRRPSVSASSVGSTFSFSLSFSFFYFREGKKKQASNVKKATETGMESLRARVYNTEWKLAAEIVTNHASSFSRLERISMAWR